MAYQGFLQELIDTSGLGSVPEIFHLVRNIPYGSTGNRDPQLVYERNVGSCSGKHILLRDLLRAADHTAEIITMFTYFNESAPVHESYPEELKRISRESRVPDFHHYVRVRIRDEWISLDATWHDRMAPFGFAVNCDWTGDGSTRLASVPEKEYPNQEDIIAFKKGLLATLPKPQRELRLRYFQLVTEWIAQTVER